jgi:flagellar secretion chaperone FliS
MPPARARNAYLSNAVAAAPPERLVTMLYDALVNNIHLAEEALAARDLYTKNEKLLKAQDIVIYLRETLKPEVWSAGPVLIDIYNYVYKLLVRGNVRNDAAALAEARKHLEPLQRAWHAAADQVLADKAARASGGSSAVA